MPAAGRARDPRTDPRDSLVLQVPAAEPVEAETHFLTQLSFETDPSDVHTDLSNGFAGFVVVDCRAPEEYAKGHVPGALNMPYKALTHESTAKLAKDMTYVVYDAGLFDNAATKSCLRMAALGLRVKEMIGGLHGWVGEGYAVEKGPAAGKLAVKAAKPEPTRIGRR